MFDPCCCISLRTGALIVAAIEIFIVAVAGSFCIIGLSSDGEGARRIREKVFILMPESPGITDNEKELVSEILLAIILVLALVRFVAAYFLAQSVVKKKPGWSYPYLVFCALVVGFQIYSVATKKLDTEGIIGLAMAIWFWLTVYYCKKDMDDGGDGLEDGKC